MRYEAQKLTGATFNGRPEVGNRCQHYHRSEAAAEKCAKIHGLGWRVGEVASQKEVAKQTRQARLQATRKEARQ